MHKQLLFTLLLAGNLFSMPPLFAQAIARNQPVNAPAQHAPELFQSGEKLSLRDALMQLRKQYGVDVLFEEKLLDGLSVSGNLLTDNAGLEPTLSRLLRTTNLRYRRIRKDAYLIVTTKSEPRVGFQAAPVLPESSGRSESGMASPVSQPVLAIPVAVAADLVVKGNVTSDRGESLPGVSVIIKGSSLGTVTDANGAYSLTVPNPQATLVFSYIGMVTQEVAVNNRATINVLLTTDTKSLEEVVVVGYGTQKKGDLTVSLASVSAAEFKDQPVTGVGQALQGRAAGVQVTQSSNAPGGGVVVRIRGGNSINAGNEPLYVIDGFPVYNSGGTDFNPSDIESVEILKDASATSIYGSRGANGVVLITTKRGKAGKGKVDFQTYYGTQEVSNTLPVLNGKDYANFVNEGRTNAGQPVLFSAAQIAAIPNGGEGTNWQNEIYRQAPIQNHQLNFSGGNDKTQYLISGNMFDQKGVLINSDFRRYSVRLNLNSQVNDWLSVGTSLNILRSETNGTPTDQDGNSGSGQSIVYGSFFFSPTQPVYDAAGDYTVFNTQNLYAIGSPVAHSTGTQNNLRVLRIFGNVFADIKILKDLTFRTSIGSDLNAAKRGEYSSRTLTLAGRNANGTARITNANAQGWLTENTLTYKKNIGPDHHFELLGGFTSQSQRNETVATSGNGFASDNLGYNGLAFASSVGRPTNSASQWQLNSFLGRVNYDYKGRYLLTATVRSDGSSRFAEGNKWGSFPSASAAWRVSEEPFLANSKIISDLKVRASYGLTGNTEIGSYLSIDTYGSSGFSYSFGNNNLVNGYVPLRVGNRNLTWEKTTQMDVGIDLSLLKNRINITADYYNKETTDLLYSVAVPSASGYSSYLTNIGKIRNKGFELAINSVNTTGAFKWTTNFNISTNQNEVVDLGGNNNLPAGGAASSANILDNGTGILRIGEAVGVFYGYEFAGIWQTGEESAAAVFGAKPGDRKYVDQNGDNRISSDLDRKILGQAQPKLIGGITNTVSYKGIDFSLLMQGVSGNSVLNMNKFELEYARGDRNVSRDMLNRWTPTNPSNTLPRANANAVFSPVSSRQVEDGSFLRVKSITLGYSLPKTLLKRAFISDLRIYVSSQNLFTFTKYSGLDPEVNRYGQSTLQQGIDYGSYPVNKSYLVGLNLSF
jgi:TonB-dependent starch-binding outer membrane protein SusC